MGDCVIKPRVLVVDDDENYRTLIRHHLESAGCQVLESSDGDDACAVLSHESVALVILDIIMPKTEGLETIVRLRRQGCRTKILAVSGVARADGYLKAAVGLGADVSFQKIKPICDLLTIVERLVRETNPSCPPELLKFAADKKE